MHINLQAHTYVSTFCLKQDAACLYHICTYNGIQCFGWLHFMTVALLSSCNTSQQSFAGWHAQWAYGLGLPLVFRVCMVLPVLIAVLTLHGRRHNQPGHPCTHCGVPYRSYHRRYCCWKAVVLLQPMVQVAINTFGVIMSPLCTKPAAAIKVKEGVVPDV
jgi:hypothetical protein